MKYTLYSDNGCYHSSFTSSKLPAFWNANIIKAKKYKLKYLLFYSKIIEDNSILYGNLKKIIIEK